MRSLLCIDASSRFDGSHLRTLADILENARSARFTGDPATVASKSARTDIRNLVQAA